MSTQPAPDAAQRNVEQHKKRFHTHKLLWILLLLVVIVLSFGATCFLNYKYSPTRCVNQFLNALDHQDYHTLKTFLSCKDVSINEESLQPFIDLYHSDKQFKQDIRNTLNRDLDLVEVDTYNSASWIKLIAHRKLFVKTYTIKVQPIKVHLITNLYPTNVTYSSDSLTIDSPEFDQELLLLPGLYQFDSRYYDESRAKEMNQTCSVTLTSDQTIDVSYPYSNLAVELPQGYKFDRLTVDDLDITKNVSCENDTLHFSPVFQDEVLTLTCINPWGQQVNTSFTIPEGYKNSTYDYACDFTATSKEFTYEQGLTLESLVINGRKVSNPKDYVSKKDCTIVLNNLTDGTAIEFNLKSPWGETYCYPYTVTAENFDEYNHKLQFFLSEKTKKKIMKVALNYYMNLFDALNQNDMEQLAVYAEDDEMANDFYVMLDNIQFDYETYAIERPGFEESIQLKLIEIIADSAQLDQYQSVISFNLNGKADATATTTDEDSQPVITTSINNYNVVLHLIYDTKKKGWKITGGYYDYDHRTIRKPVKLF